MLNLFKHMLISLYIHLTLLYVDFLLYDVALFLCLCVFQLFLLVLLGIVYKQICILGIFFRHLQISFCFNFLFLCCVFTKLILLYFVSFFLTLFQKLNLCCPIKVCVFCLFVCCFSYVCLLFFIEVEIIHKLMHYNNNNN